MLIAQISDLHIKLPGQLAYERADTAAALARCVAEIRNLPQRPDLVLMTGDLTDRGSPGEFEHLMEILEPIEQPILAVPGNHDEREAMRGAFAKHGSVAADGFLHFDFDEAHYPVRIIGLDTTVPGSAAGALCEERLAWLEARLAERPEKPTLIAMHHPPFRSGIAHMDAIGLAGREAFAALVARFRAVELITCGHLHRISSARVGGRTAMSCPSPAHIVNLDLDPGAPATFRMEPPGFLLHWWDGEALVTHQVAIGDFDGPYPFFNDKGQLRL